MVELHVNCLPEAPKLCVHAHVCECKCVCNKCELNMHIEVVMLATFVQLLPHVFPLRSRSVLWRVTY